MPAVSVPWRLRLLIARGERKLARGRQRDREEVVRAHAAGKDFCDVGCMWKVHGRIAFVAHDAGAARVTGVDVEPASPEFLEENERRQAAVRFVRGDLHDQATVSEVGPHQVVWCSGVLYHSPNPVLALTRLRALTTELLILQTTVVPELPGVKNGAIFYPGLEPGDQRLYRRAWGEHAHSGIAQPARPPNVGDDPFARWYWGLSPSTLRAMLRTAGFEPVDEWGDPFGVHVMCRPT